MCPRPNTNAPVGQCPQCRLESFLQSSTISCRTCEQPNTHKSSLAPILECSQPQQPGWCWVCVSGVFITKGDVGVGTIVGSAVFNILCIIGVCGLFAGQVRLTAELGTWGGTTWRWGRDWSGRSKTSPGASGLGQWWWGTSCPERLAQLDLETLRHYYLVSVLMDYRASRSM